MKDYMLLGGAYHGEEWSIADHIKSFMTEDGHEYFKTKIYARRMNEPAAMHEVFCTEPEEAQELFEDMLV